MVPGQDSKTDDQVVQVPPQSMNLLPGKRREEIAKLIQRMGSVRITDVTERFGVSEMTARRDLDYLHKGGVAVRTRGGAIAPKKTVSEFSLSFRGKHNLPLKLAIARAAIELIEDNDAIAFDASTTGLEVARMLSESGTSNITVVTNNLIVATELGALPDICVLVTGGTVRQTSMTLVGPAASDCMKDLNVDKAFISGRALSPQAGLTDSNLMEVAVKRAMIRSARQVVILADSTKLGYVALHKVCSLREATALITDNEADEGLVKELRDQHVNVILSEVTQDDRRLGDMIRAHRETADRPGKGLVVSEPGADA